MAHFTVLCSFRDEGHCEGDFPAFFLSTLKWHTAPIIVFFMSLRILSSGSWEDGTKKYTLVPTSMKLLCDENLSKTMSSL